MLHVTQNQECVSCSREIGYTLLSFNVQIQMIECFNKNHILTVTQIVLDPDDFITFLKSVSTSSPIRVAIVYSTIWCFVPSQPVALLYVSHLKVQQFVGWRPSHRLPPFSPEAAYIAGDLNIPHSSSLNSLSQKHKLGKRWNIWYESASFHCKFHQQSFSNRN